MVQTNIPVYKITVPITKTELVLNIRGDYHYGVKNVDIAEMKTVLKREQDQHRGNQFVIWTGDLIDNTLNNSIGHGYDMAIRDPAIQLKDMKEALIDLSKHLYGNNFKPIQSTEGNYKGVLSAGVLGNHEYRSRNTAGQWIQEEMYKPAKILDMKMDGIIELTIVNSKLKISKTYKIFVSHRANKGNATSIEAIIRAVKKRKSDISADVYVYGHYHRRVIQPDATYNEHGEFKKILYVVNPSPISYMEYADWSGFSPLEASWYVNCYLPLEGYPYGKV